MNYSILDASNDFASLSNEIGKYKIKLCKQIKIDFKSQDFRLIALDSIQQYLLSLTSYIRAFIELQKRVSPDEFLKLLNVGIFTVEEYENSGLIYKFPIESLATMIHFQIDSLFGEIEKQNGTSNTGFYNRMTTILGMINLKRGEKEDIQNTLQCLAFFRNSFHSNGYHFIHKSKWQNGTEPHVGDLDRSFSQDSHIIEFKHKEQITYNWKSVYYLVHSSISSVYTIISNIYSES